MQFARQKKQEKATLEEIRKFVLNLASSHALEIGFDTDLLGAGLIDSVAMMELLLWLEEDKGIKIAEDKLLPDNFRSITVLHAFIHESGQ